MGKKSHARDELLTGLGGGMGLHISMLIDQPVDQHQRPAAKPSPMRPWQDAGMYFRAFDQHGTGQSSAQPDRNNIPIAREREELFPADGSSLTQRSIGCL